MSNELFFEDANLDFLLYASATGDRAAFTRLYELASPRSLGAARRLLRDERMAEEVNQETWLQIWTKADQFDSELGPALNWILLLTRRRAI